MFFLTTFIITNCFFFSLYQTTITILDKSIFHVLALFPLKQRVNVRVSSKVTVRLKTFDFQKLGNFKEISEIFRIKGKSPLGYSKWKFWRLHLKVAKKNSNKTFHWKTYLFNFENLSTILYPRLYLPTLLCLSTYQTTCWHLSWLTDKFTTTKSTMSTFFKNCMIATIIWDNFSGKKLSYIRRITGKGTRLLMTR